MEIAIIGGGLGGLSSAFFLSEKGHHVQLFEMEETLGGLSASFKEKGWEWSLENFYHHFFSSDKQLISLAKKLNLGNSLKFRTPKTSVFLNNKIYQFDNPKTILKFPLLNIFDKFRTAATSVLLKANFYWSPLEKITAANFIKKTMGKNTYEKIWQPLLKSKFGSFYEDIPSSWFWTRIKKRSFQLGYFEGGNQILIDKLAENIKKNNGEIHLDCEIKNLDDLNQYGKFDKIIAAVPSQILLKIAPSLPENFQKKISNLKMIGCLNLVFSLKENFLTEGTYWLNINEPGFPFVAVVEHTNFIDPKHYGNDRVLYVGGYYPQNHRYFKMTKGEILKEFLPYLKKINPNFKFQSSNFKLFANLYAQPIPTINYSQTLLPSINTPLPNLYWLSLHHVYPEDRGVNYAIKLAKKVADEITKSK